MIIYVRINMIKDALKCIKIEMTFFYDKIEMTLIVTKQ